MKILNTLKLCKSCLLQTLNPLIDTTDETYITIVLSLLKDISSESELTLSKNDDIINIDCVTNSEGVTVKFHLNLKLSDAATVSIHTLVFYLHL